MQEVIAYAKADPKKLKNAARSRSVSGTLLEMFRLQAGIELPIVQYRGASDAVAATSAGETDIVIMDGTSVFPHIKAGRVRGLAIAADKRLPELPDVPTTAEAGLPNYKVEFWYTAFAQGQTPKPIVDRLGTRKSIRRSLRRKSRRSCARWVLVRCARTADDFTATQHYREMDEWAEIVKQAGFKPMDITPSKVFRRAPMGGKAQFIIRGNEKMSGANPAGRAKTSRSNSRMALPGSH